MLMNEMNNKEWEEIDRTFGDYIHTYTVSQGL